MPCIGRAWPLGCLAIGRMPQRRRRFEGLHFGPSATMAVGTAIHPGTRSNGAGNRKCRARAAAMHGKRDTSGHRMQAAVPPRPGPA